MEVLSLTYEEFLYRRTEEYALKKEQEERNWHANHEQEEEQLIEKINSLLGEHTPEAWDTLLTMFENPKLHDIFADRDSIALVYILLNIYQYERYEEISPTILSQGTDINHFQNFMRDIKFLVWRLCFFDIANSSKSDYGNTVAEENALFDYIEKHNISPVALFFLINSLCADPQKMLLYISYKYLEINLYYARVILEYYDIHYPGNEDVKYILSEMRKNYE